MTIMARWERLAASLGDVASVKVDRFGECHRINIRAGSTRIVVADTWWRKNLDVWTGWEVYVEDADSIVRRTYPRTKKRGEVRQHVKDALASIGS